MILKTLLLLSSRPSAYTLGILGLIVGSFVNGYCKGFVLSTAALTLYQQLPKGKRWLKRAAVPVGLILVLVLASLPARAQFSVVDWGSISQEVQTIAQLRQMYQNAVQMYTVTKQNLVALTNKNTYQAAGMALFGSNAANRYGELNGWNSAMNTGSGIPQAYGNATLPLSSNTSFLSSEQLGKSTHLADLALVSVIDSTSQNTMATVSQVLQQSANQTPVAIWERSIYDTNPAYNTAAAQQNLTNLGMVQMYEQGKANLAVNSILAQQLTLQNMRDRNLTVQDLNRWQEVADYQATQPHALGGMEQTIHNQQPY